MQNTRAAISRRFRFSQPRRRRHDGRPRGGRGGLGASAPRPAAVPRGARRRSGRGRSTGPRPSGRGGPSPDGEADAGVGNRRPRPRPALGTARTSAGRRRRRNGPDRPVLKHGPRSPTRARALGRTETRGRGAKAKRPRPTGRGPRREGPLLSGRDRHRRPIRISLEGFERERARRDPKDRELWAARTKPEETLVEVRSGTDVQIVRPSCL